MNEYLKLSIIMPVYNAEKYLAKTIESYCNQSFRNIEIICVDDGSTDSSLEILHYFVKKDSRIRVFKQQNSGPAVARQKGLNNANGDYIWFVDADDDCEQNSIRKIMNIIKEYHIDILYFGTKLIYDSTTKNSSESYYALRNIQSSRFYKVLEFNKNAYLLFSLPRELWNKVYRRKYILDNQISFCPHISLYDDILFTTQCLINSPNVMLIKECLYNYHLNHTNSIMNTANERLDGIFYYFKLMYKLLSEKSYNAYVKRNWLCKEICSMNFWLTRENINKHYYFKNLKEIYRGIKKEIYDMVPCDSYQQKNKKLAIEIIETPYYKLKIKN